MHVAGVVPYFYVCACLMECFIVAMYKQPSVSQIAYPLQHADQIRSLDLDSELVWVWCCILLKVCICK